MVSSCTTVTRSGESLVTDFFCCSPHRHSVLVFVFLFSSGFYSSMSPHGHGTWGKETYITPSAFVWYVWTVIDLLLCGFVIYQFFDQSHDTVHAVGWRFALVGVLNAIFLHTFVTAHYIVAFIFALLTASVVSTVYASLAANPAGDVLSLVFVHLPFSLWHAFSILVSFVSGFAAFTHGGHGHHPSLVVKVLVVISLAAWAIVAIGYAFRTRRGDIAGALVLVFALYGVFDHVCSFSRLDLFAQLTLLCSPCAATQQADPLLCPGLLHRQRSCRCQVTVLPLCFPRWSRLARKRRKGTPRRVSPWLTHSPGAPQATVLWRQRPRISRPNSPLLVFPLPTLLAYLVLPSL